MCDDYTYIRVLANIYNMYILYTTVVSHVILYIPLNSWCFIELYNCFYKWINILLKAYNG